MHEILIVATNQGQHYAIFENVLGILRDYWLTLKNKKFDFEKDDHF